MPKHIQPDNKELHFSLRAEKAVIEGKGFNCIEKEETVKVSKNEASEFMQVYNTCLSPKGKEVVQKMSVSECLELISVFTPKTEEA